MHKLMLVAVTTMVAALVVVGVASAVDATQAIDVKITHNKAGTKASRSPSASSTW